MNTVKKQILTFLAIIGLSAPLYAAQPPLVFAEGTPEHTRVGMFSNEISDLLRNSQQVDFSVLGNSKQVDFTVLCNKYASEFKNPLYQALIDKHANEKKVRFPGNIPGKYFSIRKTILMVILQNVVGAFFAVVKDAQGKKTQKSCPYVLSKEYCTNLMEQLKPKTPEPFLAGLGNEEAQNKFWEQFATIMHTTCMHTTCSEIQTVSMPASSSEEVIGQVPSSDDEQFIACVAQIAKDIIKNELQKQLKEQQLKEQQLKEQLKARTKRRLYTGIRHAICTTPVVVLTLSSLTLPGPQAPWIETASGFVVKSIGALLLNKILKKTVIS